MPPPPIGAGDQVEDRLDVGVAVAVEGAHDWASWRGVDYVGSEEAADA
jgi:hypothetical protein